MRRTAGKNGTQPGWALVANVEADEIRRLQRMADALEGDVGLLRHHTGIPFAVTRIDAGVKRYAFLLPLVGRDVLAMLRLLPVCGFRVAFSCGTPELHRYALPVMPEAVNELLKSHLHRYSKQSVLNAASDVAADLLRDARLEGPGPEHLVCVVPTPELQTWAARRYHGE